VDDEECNAGKDLNFELTGFRVSGVLAGASLSSCASGSSGPANVQVTLLQDEHPVQEVLTLEGGVFAFENVASGQYEVRATHQVWKFIQQTQFVHVATNTVVLDPHLQLAGYNIR
jgi:BOS complex subunit NOMO1-like, second beta sandwich domain